MDLELALMKHGHKSDSIYIRMQNEPHFRDKLPWYKDPKVKVSFWTILKDMIGKDIAKMSVPVYFNEPLSLL